MQMIAILTVAAIVFGICYAVDKAFTRIFRNKAQHRSGMAIRVTKKYGIFGVMLTILGILSIVVGLGGDKVMLVGGCVVLLMGIALAIYYLTYGIFYDGESFLVSAPFRKGREYRFSQIREQQLYVVTGGSNVIELVMDDGTSVSLQSTMDGVYTFMDTAFAGWCMQTGQEMDECSFYDPSNSWWFPHDVEEK